MILYAAGGHSDYYSLTINKYKLGRLFSYLNELRHIEKYKDVFDVVFVDSGAHSWNKLTINKIGTPPRGEMPDINEYHNGYINYIKANSNKNMIFVELDAYAFLSEKKLDETCQEVNSIKDKKITYLRVYHPSIDEGSLKTLDKWIAEGHDYIGIGNDSIYLCDAIFKRTKDKVKVHGFAMTKLNLFLKYPFYSADSLTPLASQMYGQLFENNRSKSKVKLHEEKHIGVAYSDKRRLEQSIKNFKEFEDFVTSLWKYRGVVWN